MIYSQTIDKIGRTILTCNKIEQLIMAKKYSHRLVGAYIKEYRKEKQYECSFKVHFAVLKIIGEFTERIKKLCAEWVINNEPMVEVNE